MFSFCQMRVHTAGTQIKRYNPSKNTPKFCNFKLEHRNISKYPFSYFPGCGIHMTRPSFSFFLYNLFANLKIIFFCRSKEPIDTSFSNSLECLIKLILKKIKINIRQHSRTFFPNNF